MITETLGETFDVASATNAQATPQAMVRVDRLKGARRAIDAPSFEFSPTPGASSYELLLKPVDGDRQGWRLRSAAPRFPLAEVWKQVPLGRFRYLALARDHDNRVIGSGACSTFVRSPDWQEEAPVLSDWRGAAHGVVDYLLRRIPSAENHPEEPAYMWHASASVGVPFTFHPMQFPTLCYTSFIRLFVAVAARGSAGDPDALPMARRLCDFLIEHPAIKEGPLAGVPWSTMDNAGRGGMWEKDSITLTRLGWLGCAALELGRVTGDDRYRDYAHRLAWLLLKFQRDDGSWPYRVRLQDGSTTEPYTDGSIIALLLLEQLESAPDDQLRAAIAQGIPRGLSWILENPARTGLWQQMYEDVTSLEPYENLEQWAALETAMFLLRRTPDTSIDLARQLVRYVEDQFVIFGPEPSLTPVAYVPLTPSTMEQYKCYWPMDAHTSNYARACTSMYEATGEKSWLHKAIGAANTIVGCRLPDGRLSTVVPDRDLHEPPLFAAWYNCMAHAALGLLELGPRLERASRQ